MTATSKEGLASFLSAPEWLVEEATFDASQLNFYETIFCVGNGYQGTRGTLEEGYRGALPATYLAGIYDHHDSTVVDLVSAPDWLPFKVFVEGTALNLHTCRIVEYRRVLDMRRGVLYRLTRYEDAQGRLTRYESLRFASFADQHLAGMRVLITPENYDGSLTVEGGIDGHRRNLDRMPHYTEPPDFPVESKWEKWAKSKHLALLETETSDHAVYLAMKTLDRGHQLGYASSLSLDGNGGEGGVRIEYESIAEHITIEAQKGRIYTFDKLVVIATSRDMAPESIKGQCLEWLGSYQQHGFVSCLQEHITAWDERWKDCDCVITGDDAANHAVRFNIYHMLIAGNPNDPGVNIGAKSMSGEGYKGHVFWDTEIFLLPFFIYNQPLTAKALLQYRYQCLKAALDNARSNGFRGAQYPWESADTGEETTPQWTHDGKHRIWTGEEEIHITADVAYGVLTYLTATDDWDFMLHYGAEMVFQTARFWDSRLEYDSVKDRYELNRVIGPDEFHEHVDNNIFTNWMARWNLEQASATYHLMEELYGSALHALASRLDLTKDEVSRWLTKASKVYLPYDKEKRLIEQFEGYFQCKEVPISEFDENDMPIYPKGYDHFNAGETTLVKQPDVVMLMYVLPDEFDDETKRINYDFYEKRTMHKSSLSPSVHCIMGIEVGDTSRAVQYFRRSAFVDLIDNQGNTEMGIHAASAGGTWMCVVFGFGGFRVKNHQMTFKPWLPEGWEEVRFVLKWHGDNIRVSLSQDAISFYRESQKDQPLQVVVQDKMIDMPSAESVTVALT